MNAFWTFSASQRRLPWSSANVLGSYIMQADEPVWLQLARQRLSQLEARANEVTKTLEGYGSAKPSYAYEVSQRRLAGIRQSIEVLKEPIRLLEEATGNLRRSADTRPGL